MSDIKLVEVKNLKKYFHLDKNLTLKAVDDVSFFIRKGETLGLVGESGCGKTTCGRTLIGLYNATDGEVLFDGQDIHKLNGKEKLKFKRRAQIIFQDPYASLDPRMTIGDIIGEGIDVHFNISSSEKRAKVEDLLSKVGLTKEHYQRFPHELSGGQRQRIGIARALYHNPELLVLDEATSALDNETEAEVMKAIDGMSGNKTIIMIAHRLSTVERCDMLIKIQNGKII